jgi:Mg/Co/Ni transporter MgtE
MNPRFVRLRPEFTVDEAIRYVRIQGRDLAQPIGDAYVLDLEQRLLGIVSPLERFSWPVDRTIDGLMRTDRITVSELERIRRRLFRRYQPTDYFIVSKSERVIQYDVPASTVNYGAGTARLRRNARR